MFWRMCFINQGSTGGFAYGWTFQDARQVCFILLHRAYSSLVSPQFRRKNTWLTSEHLSQGSWEQHTVNSTWYIKPTALLYPMNILYGTVVNIWKKHHWYFLRRGWFAPLTIIYMFFWVARIYPESVERNPDTSPKSPASSCYTPHGNHRASQPALGLGRSRRNPHGTLRSRKPGWKKRCGWIIKHEI